LQFVGRIGRRAPNDDECKQPYLATSWAASGPSFLGTALPTWLQPGDGDDDRFMAPWFVLVLLLIVAVGAIVTQSGLRRPRSGRLALAALGLYIVQWTVLGHSNLHGQLYHSLGFSVNFLLEAVLLPFWYYIFWLDTKYWTSFTFDGDTTPEALDRLEADPLKCAMATELSPRSPHHPIQSDLLENKRAPHIPFNAIQFNKKLASGAAGVVWKAQVRGNSRAVKSMSCAKIDKETVSSLCKEVELSWLLSGSCQNIVHCDGFCVNPPEVYVIMQLCNRGSLLDVLGKNATKAVRLRLAAEAAVAVAHLHSLGIVHRDLKSLNVMCSESEGQIAAYLGDFGESATVTEVEKEARHQTGTLAWMAPEIIENWKVGRKSADGSEFLGSQYTQAADCFSLAVILWECLTQKSPYFDTMHPKINKPLVLVDPLMLGDKIVDGLRPSTGEWAQGFSADILQAMECGWSHNPLDRSTAQGIRDAAYAEVGRPECRKFEWLPENSNLDQSVMVVDQAENIHLKLTEMNDGNSYVVRL